MCADKWLYDLHLGEPFEKVELIGQEEGKLKPNPRCLVTSQKTEKLAV